MSKEKVKKDAPRFILEQFLKSKQFSSNPDVLRVLLDKDTGYTIEEVELKIKRFLEGAD